MTETVRKTVCSHGACLAVEFPDREMAHRFPFAPWLESSNSGPPDIVFQVKNHNVGTWTLRKAGRRTLQYHSVEALFQRLRADIDAAIAQFSRGPLFLHAGVCVFEDMAILLPGKSGSGKTTLVYEALSRGAVYYSDEYALVEADGTVLPFARPLSVKIDGHREKKLFTPASLGAEIGLAPLRIDVVAVTHFVEGAKWQPDILSPSEVVFEMVHNTIAAESRPEDTLSRTALLIPPCPAVKGVRGEASDWLDWIVSEYKR